MSRTTRRSIPMVFVDTNVFYPVRLADLVLSSVGDALFDLCVSDHLLDEIERVLIHDKGLTAEKSHVFREAVRASATVHVEAHQYDQVRDQIDGPDADDLWHLAAAISSEADLVLTANVRDYDRAHVPDALKGVAAVNPDDFFEQLLADGLGDDIATTISRMSTRLTNPHRSPSDIIDGLEKIGLTKTARQLRNR